MYNVGDAFSSVVIITCSYKKIVCSFQDADLSLSSKQSGQHDIVCVKDAPPNKRRYPFVSEPATTYREGCAAATPEAGGDRMQQQLQKHTGTMFSSFYDEFMRNLDAYSDNDTKLYVLLITVKNLYYRIYFSSV